MKKDTPQKIAFIIPRYVESSAGGAEVACRHFAEKLKSQKGIPTEILTTCAEDNSTWKNTKDPGSVEKNGILVRFFPVEERKNPGEYLSAVLKNDAKQKLTPIEEDFYFNNNVNSESLYRFIKEHGEEYAFFIFTPYLFGTTVNGAKIHPHKTLIRPCFHDESYARMSSIKKMFQDVLGIICNSPMEKELIIQLGKVNDNKVFLAGEGVEASKEIEDENILSSLSITKPYIYYCGRRERGKNFDFLIELFREYKRQNKNSLQFVTSGTHAIEIMPSEISDIIDVGFVSESLKSRLYKSALLTCQASTKESFSIATMESWLQKRPVLVNKRSKVLDYWVRLSNGGFSFKTFYEFEELLNYSQQNQKVLDKMGKSGYEFTVANFKWEKIVDRFYKALIYFGYKG